jgi:hypothetical protein
MKKFTVTFTADECENIEIDARNDGFTSFELIALLELKKNDIFAQICPTSNFKRVFVDRDSNEVEIKEE